MFPSSVRKGAQIRLEALYPVLPAVLLPRLVRRHGPVAHLHFAILQKSFCTSRESAKMDAPENSGGIHALVGGPIPVPRFFGYNGEKTVFSPTRMFFRFYPRKSAGAPADESLLVEQICQMRRQFLRRNADIIQRILHSGFHQSGDFVGFVS